MSNYNNLKTTIDASIKQNNNQEITGSVLNSVLNQMVTTLGAGYQFAGVATIATNPGTPDAKVFYIANGKGTYTNFGGLEVTEDDVVILYYDTSWHKVATGIASQEKLSELEFKQFPLSNDNFVNSLVKEIYMETQVDNFLPSKIYFFLGYLSSNGTHYNRIRLTVDNYTTSTYIVDREYNTESEALTDLKNIKGIFPFSSNGCSGYVYLDLSSVDAPISEEYNTSFYDTTVLWNSPTIMGYLMAKNDDVVNLKNNVHEIDLTLKSHDNELINLNSTIFKKDNIFQLVNIGYIAVGSGGINSTSNGANTGQIALAGYTKLLAKARISSAGAMVAFYDSEHIYLSDISIIGDNTLQDITIDLTQDTYSNAAYVNVSTYDATQQFQDYYLHLMNDNSVEYNIDELDKRVTLLENQQHYNTFVILGDSYSTFKGYLDPSSNGSWYSEDGTYENDVKSVENTWWYKFAREYGSTLIQNNSYSGSTICYNGYSGGLADGKATSFCVRGENLKQSELILIFGGTNDYWVSLDTQEDTLGQFKYSDWTETDKETMRPALAYLLDYLQHHHIGTRIIFILNTSLGTDYSSSIKTICEHYGVGVLELTNIGKTNSHPNIEGMESIKNQLIKFLG